MIACKESDFYGQPAVYSEAVMDVAYDKAAGDNTNMMA